MCFEMCAVNVCGDMCVVICVVKCAWWYVCGDMCVVICVWWYVCGEMCVVILCGDMCVVICVWWNVRGDMHVLCQFHQRRIIEQDQETTDVYKWAKIMLSFVYERIKEKCVLFTQRIRLRWIVD